MHFPKYTFLLPAYKDHYLHETLLSIKNQTFTDFLCIVSDDCSPENIKGVYDEIVGEDTRFYYKRNDENIGSRSLVKHWNQLVDLCKSEFLIMSSDDDVYSPKFLECMDKLQQKYPESDLLRGRVQLIDGNGEKLDEDSLFIECQSSMQFLFDVYYSNHIHCIANYIFRTDTLKCKGGFVEFPLAWFSDDATVFLCSTNGVISSKDVLFCFRLSTLNISSGKDKSNTLKYSKLIAAEMQYWDFMASAFSKVVVDNTMFAKNRMRKIESGVKNRILYQMEIHRKYLCRVDLYHLYFWYKTKGIISGFLPSFKFLLRNIIFK